MALKEFFNKETNYDKAIDLGYTVLEISKLHLYDVFYNTLQPSPKGLQIHYM